MLHFCSGTQSYPLVACTLGGIYSNTVPDGNFASVASILPAVGFSNLKTTRPITEPDGWKMMSLKESQSSMVRGFATSSKPCSPIVIEESLFVIMFPAMKKEEGIGVCVGGGGVGVYNLWRLRKAGSAATEAVLWHGPTHKGKSARLIEQINHQHTGDDSSRRCGRYVEWFEGRHSNF